MIGRAKCFCGWTRIIDDSEINAQDEPAAKDKFKSKHKLCPDCLKSDTKMGVEFDSLIDVKRLPRF